MNAARTSLAALSLAALTNACAIEQPFNGPGMENGAVKDPHDGDYFASTTHLRLKDVDDAGEAFDRHMKAIQEALQTQPGLVGFSLSFVPFNNDEYRTLSVWESEEAMLGWVTSDVHFAAIEEFVDRDLQDGGSVHAWPVKAAEVPPTWADARERLSKDGRAAY
jgi:heme-degrading monooxygenase HmoA